MQRKLSTRLLATTIMALLATGCTQSSDDGYTPEGTPRSISFGTGVTRAAVDENKNNMQPFSVWGGCGGSHSNLFNKVEVQPDGTYGGGARYWVMDKMHDFYAMHPHVAGNTTWIHNTNGMLTASGFTTAAIGANAIDLMTASATGITPTMEQPDPGPVELHFKHELAQVKFSITAESEIIINAVNLCGIAYKGDFTSAIGTTPALWEDLRYAVPGTTPFHLTPNRTVSAADTYTPFDYLLLIPQELYATAVTDATTQETKGPATLTLTYRYANDAATVSDRTTSVTLHTTQVPKWIAGQSYNYALAIKANTTGITLNVTIKPWEESMIDTTVDW